VDRVSPVPDLVPFAEVTRQLAIREPEGKEALGGLVLQPAGERDGLDRSDAMALPTITT
jgi:hypothetical protein